MSLRFCCAAGVLAFAAALYSQAPPAATPATPLPWAFPFDPNAPKQAPPPDDKEIRHVPNSSKGLTQKQILDGFNPPDWHSDFTSATPQLVAHGRPQDIRACGFCHLPNGQGRPENASLAGLPAAYIEQQVSDYRSGARKSSEPNMGPPASMLKLAQASNEAEVKTAAEYFSKMKYKPWIKVMESKTAPKTRVATGMLVAIEGTSEPLGQRIVETAQNLEATENRDDGSPFVAYVPMGSIKKGEAFVNSGGNGKSVRCSICHGTDLKGLGNVPFLAGRSPSYLVRQLYDIKNGNRHGPWSPLMKEAVANMTTDDMINVAAYISSRTP